MPVTSIEKKGYPMGQLTSQKIMALASPNKFVHLSTPLEDGAAIDCGEPGEETSEQMVARFLSEEVLTAFDAALSPNTLRRYRTVLNHFALWCDDNRTPVMPAAPEAVASYLVSLHKAGLKASTISNAMSGIQYAHHVGCFVSPTDTVLVRTVLRGIVRTDTRRTERKNAATVESIAAMLSHLPPGLSGVRTKALLLTGFGGALRRSELVGLTVEHVRFVPLGAELFLPHSKTDPFSRGTTVAIPHGSNLKPVEALQRWLDVAQITSGPIFRGVYGSTVKTQQMSDVTVTRIVKSLAKKAGLDPQHYASHSLRAGFITSASERGVKIGRIMQHSRHKSADRMLEYVREQNRFKDHAGAAFL